MVEAQRRLLSFRPLGSLLCVGSTLGVQTKRARQNEIMFVDIVFHGPPSPESGRFVEVENQHGRSVDVGEWVRRADGFWALRISPSDITALARNPSDGG